MGGYNDGSVDRFIYRSVGDSTASVEGRDVVFNFYDDAINGEDIIDFRALNIQTANVFYSNAFNAGDGHADVRIEQNEDHTLIFVDVNDDGTADLSIKVVAEAFYDDDDNVSYYDYTWDYDDFAFA
jgi:Peptidase M10 serralysin C terminal